MRPLMTDEKKPQGLREADDPKDGRIELAAVDGEADDFMDMAEDIMAENSAVLRALAR